MPAPLWVRQVTHRELDEDDVRVRPQRGKSRPRTKHRPAHVSGVVGRVTTVDRGRFSCVVEGSAELVYAVKARDLGRKGVVVGDEVWLTGDAGGGLDNLARIVRVHERRTVLRRSADDSDPVERVIVANADQLAIVVSMRDPDPSPGLIDRCLVAAYDAGLDPLLVLTKADLADPDTLVGLYRDLDVPTLVSGWAADEDLDGPLVDQVRIRLRERITVMVGHSGVGKSTLVNSLVPGAARSTGEVNEVTGRGRHTSSQAVAMRLPGSGWIIDTPGVRSFGLAHVLPARVVSAFPELATAAQACPRGCGHGSADIDCALDAAVASGDLGPGAQRRLASLRRLLASQLGSPAPANDLT